MWTLALVLRAVLRFVQSADEIPQILFEPRFVQCVISLASMGTGFSRQWLVSDIEVY